MSELSFDMSEVLLVFIRCAVLQLMSLVEDKKQKPTRLHIRAGSK
jgi:hypothetical protein